MSLALTEITVLIPLKTFSAFRYEKNNIMQAIFNFQQQSTFIRSALVVLTFVLLKIQSVSASDFDFGEPGKTVTEDNPVVDYCAAGAVVCNLGRISQVKLNTISNSSTGQSGYEAFTSISTDLKRQLTYPIEITRNNYSMYAYEAIVWIDYNKDGDFIDPEEKVFTGTSVYESIKGNITIPVTATLGTTRMRIRSYNKNYDQNLSPCGNSQEGEVEDYSVNILANPCSGTPNPGALTASIAQPVLPGQSFTLGYSNPCGENIIHSWQRSVGNGIFSIIPGANKSTYTVSSIDTTTYYRCLLACPTTSGPGIASDHITMHLSRYCTAASTNWIYGKINKVIFNTLVNASTTETGYEFFPSVTTNVNRLQTYNISVDYLTSGWPDLQGIVWIDYNKDNDFTDPGEMVLTSNNSMSTFGKITIPLTAKPGRTTMRVRSNAPGNGSNMTPCGNSLRGQVEDYLINIIANPCSGAPNPGTLSCSISQPVFQGQGFTLSYSNFCGENLSHIWQSSLDGTNWFVISSATEPTYTVSSINATTWYRCSVKCANSGQTTSTPPLQIVYSPYCAAGTYTNNIAAGTINKVTFNTINNGSTGYSGYQCYFHVSTNVNRGSSYSISVTCSGPRYADDKLIVWIDYNKDGDFVDPGETVFTANGNASTYTGSIIIPQTAVTGNTIMRIRAVSTGGSTEGNSTPCGNSQLGQVEDYTVNIQ